MDDLRKESPMSSEGAVERNRSQRHELVARPRARAPDRPDGEITRINVVALVLDPAKIGKTTLGLERDLIAHMRGVYEPALGNIVKA